MTPQFRPILIVDDDALCCQSLADMLRKAGYRVEQTTDPLHALFRTMQQRYAAVITDLEMPGLSGTRLLAALKRWSPHTPGILVSGFPDARAYADARAVDAAVLSKPVALDTLLTTVRHALGLSTEERAAS